MVEDPNLELLSMVHGVLSTSLDFQKTLDQLIESAKDSDGIVMSLASIAGISSLLKVQNKMISGLAEQNQQIVDHVNALVSRLENK